MARTDSSPKRPLIGVKDRSVAGEVLDNGAQFADMGQDTTFIQGYSDKRRQIDAAASKRQDADVELTHRYHWVRTKRNNGTADGADIASFRAKGFRPVRFDEMESLGLQTYTGTKTVDGHVSLGDTELYVCDAATAERNEAIARRAVEVRSTGDTTSSKLRRASEEAGSRGDDLQSLEQRTEITPHA